MDRLDAGALEVALSPRGCVRYRRSMAGDELASQTLTIAGATVLDYTYTSTTASGREDRDGDGFFEWRSDLTLAAY